MMRVLVMFAVFTAVTVADASAAGRLRARSGCGCTQPVVMQGAFVPATPTVPSGNHHSAAPTPVGGIDTISAEKPKAGCCAKGAACCDKGAACCENDKSLTTKSTVTAEKTKAGCCVKGASCCEKGAACCGKDKTLATEVTTTSEKTMLDAKAVTLEGTMACAKCGLKEEGVKKCTNALQVKEGEKTLTYYLDDKGNGEDYHDGLCGGGKKVGVKVTGTVTDKDGKKWVKATKVEEKK